MDVINSDGIEKSGGIDKTDWAAGAVPLVSVTRGEEPDVRHSGMACLMDSQGKVLWSLGDVEARTFLRSSAKPLQALPVLASGAAAAFGFDNRDLAIICGSHSGGLEQADQVGRILAKSGLTEEDLGCGDGLADQCSGKHAGMIAGCKHLGLPIDGYLDRDHPWQRKILATLCECCGLQTGEIRVAEDGCSAPTFSMPIRNIALGFARLASEASAAASPGNAARAPGNAARLLEAMFENPALTGEPDLQSLSDMETGRLVSKGGVNGMLCAALPALGLGFAMKVADGSAVPRWPVLIHALSRAGIVSDTDLRRLQQALWPRILSRRGKVVGQVRIEF